MQIINTEHYKELLNYVPPMWDFVLYFRPFILCLFWVKFLRNLHKSEEIFIIWFIVTH